LNSHAGFLTRNHKLIFREASAKLFSQTNRVKNEGGLTRVAPLVVEAALSSERSVWGAFARLFNKQDCRQSYYREECYETHVRSRTLGFSPDDMGG
jgi:hypothetical protein